MNLNFVGKVSSFASMVTFKILEILFLKSQSCEMSSDESYQAAAYFRGSPGRDGHISQAHSLTVVCIIIYEKKE